MSTDAMASSNGPDAFIGIVGGSPQPYTYSANGNFNAGGYYTNTDHGYPNAYGGWGRYDGGNRTGY